jgi:hypothetical protein
MKNLVLLFSIVQLSVFGQTVTPQVMSNGGGFTQTPSGMIAWTFAEPVSATYFASQRYMTMGFHQTDVELGPLIGENRNDGALIVYPNAVADFLNLEFKGLPNGAFDLTMVDAAGRLVYQSTINLTEAETRYSIVMSRFASGTYYLSIKNPGISKTLQIIKTTN